MAASRCRALFLVFDRPGSGPSPVNGFRQIQRAHQPGRVPYEVFEILRGLLIKWNFKTDPARCEQTSNRRARRKRSGEASPSRDSIWSSITGSRGQVRYREAGDNCTGTVLGGARRAGMALDILEGGLMQAKAWGRDRKLFQVSKATTLTSNGMHCRINSLIRWRTI